MYDDFRRAKQNYKKAFNFSFCRNPIHPHRYEHHFENLRKNCSKRDIVADLDEDFQIGLDTNGLLAKDTRSYGAPYACIDQINTPTRLQNLHLIKNLVALLKQKIAARLQVEKIVADSRYLGTCRIPGNSKSGSFNVNVLPFLPKKTNAQSGFSSDFSSILEDVNALESFLKVVAPLFMNYILAQKQTEEQRETELHPSDRGTENETQQRFDRSVKDIHSPEGKLSKNDDEKKLVALDVKKRGINSNELSQKLTAQTDNVPPEDASTDTTLEQQSSPSCDCTSSKDSEYSLNLKLGESNSLTSASWESEEINNCNFDFFSQDQYMLQERIPSYPSFEQQFESSACFQVNGFSKETSLAETNTAAGKYNERKITPLSTLKLPSAKGNLQRTTNSNKETIDYSFLLEKTNTPKKEQDHILKPLSSCKVQSEKAIDMTTHYDSIRQTKPPILSSCRYSLPSVTHGALQSVPLDFNLNALHMKPAFSEEHIAESANMDAETCTSVGAQEIPIAAVKSSEAYRRCMAFTKHTSDASDQLRSRKISEPEYFEEDRVYCFDRAKNIGGGVLGEEHCNNRQVEHRRGDPFLKVDHLRQKQDSILSMKFLCPSVLVFSVISGACWMSSTPWEIWLLVTFSGVCSLLVLSLFGSFMNMRMQDDTKRTQMREHHSKEPWNESLDSDPLWSYKTSKQAKSTEQLSATTEGFNVGVAKSGSSTSFAEHSVERNTGIFSSTQEDARRQSLHESIFQNVTQNSIEEKKSNVNRDLKNGTDNCMSWYDSPEEQQVTSSSSPLYPRTFTDCASTMTDQFFEWMPELGQLQMPDTCMAGTMTESPTMTSSAAQTDVSACLLDEDSDGEDSGQVQVVELPGSFSPPITATVGVQADMGARRLSQKTEKVRREHQMSLKRLRRKFLSIRRKCQMEALALKQCDQRKKNFLCQLQLSLPGLQQEKRSLLAERAAIERQFEDEKKKNRDLVGRLTRLNHQFSKLGQAQQQLPLPPSQSWRQHHQQHNQQGTPYSSANSPESANNTPTSSMSTSTSNHSSQDENPLLHHRFNHPHHNQQKQGTSLSSGCRGNTGAAGHCLSVFSQSKMAKLLTVPGGSVGSALPMPKTMVAQQQSTLLQTGQVRPNNAVPTSSGHSTTYQDHKPQQQQQPQQQQHARQQQQQQQIIMKQQQILQQQQRLPIFQLFNRPAGSGQVMQDGSSVQQQHQQQNQ